MFRSAADQTQKIADEYIVLSIRFVVGQQQQIDEVFPLSVGCDVERDGLSFVESYDVDGDVFVQTFELGDVLDG